LVSFELTKEPQGIKDWLTDTPIMGFVML